MPDDPVLPARRYALPETCRKAGMRRQHLGVRNTMSVTEGLMTQQVRRPRTIPVQLVVRTLLVVIVLLHVVNLFAQQAPDV